MNSGVKPPKQTVFITKSMKKSFLLTNSGVTSSILRVSGLELHSSSTEPVNFFGAQSLFGGGAQPVILGGMAPQCPSVAPGLLQMNYPLNSKFCLYVLVTLNLSSYNGIVIFGRC